MTIGLKRLFAFVSESHKLCVFKLINFMPKVQLRAIFKEKELLNIVISQKLMHTYDVIKSTFHICLCFVLHFETCTQSDELFILLTDLLQV